MKASPEKSEQFPHLFIHQTDYIRHNITPVSRSITNHSETSATSLASLSDLDYYFQALCFRLSIMTILISIVMLKIHNYMSYLLVAMQACFHISWPAFLTSRAVRPKIASAVMIFSLRSSYLVPQPDQQSLKQSWEPVYQHPPVIWMWTSVLICILIIKSQRWCNCFIKIRNNAKVKNVAVMLIMKWSWPALHVNDLTSLWRWLFQNLLSTMQKGDTNKHYKVMFLCNNMIFLCYLNIQTLVVTIHYLYSKYMKHVNVVPLILRSFKLLKCKDLHFTFIVK